MAGPGPRPWTNVRLVLVAVLCSVYYFSLPSSCRPSPAGSSSFRRPLSLEETEDNATRVAPRFPPDLFTLEQKKRGAVVLHVLGLIYSFVALAVVCDQFFVPALEVVTDRLAIPEDVAGATFMAAGGSAPELFTSVIGVFVSYDDVGIGTIVGSAVFNILFVVSMCAVFSRSVLRLTWWPLFRDVSFYSVSLLALIACFGDSLIRWYEAAALLLCYLLYVLFMVFNARIEKRLKTWLNRKSTKIGSSDPPPDRAGRSEREETEPPAGGQLRRGLLQLMIHSIDPLYSEGQSEGGGSQLQTVASVRVLLDAAPWQARRSVDPEWSASRVDRSVQTDPSELNVLALKEGRGRPRLEPLPPKTCGNSAAENGTVEGPTDGRQVRFQENRETPEPVREESEPLDMSWPDTVKKRIGYLLLAPIVVPLWITLPDVRRQEKKKWFVFSFVGSILWIAAFSYLMVWWASLVGEVIGIPNEVMGMVVLAAGTSVPDLITSVLVARKGLGDMAVSSSIGSNLFDITVGLPLPWLLSAWIFGPVRVNSSGMICSVVLLFLMLLFVIVSIASFKWKMNTGLAVVMLALYFVFVALSLLLEYEIISCTDAINWVGL